MDRIKRIIAIFFGLLVQKKLGKKIKNTMEMKNMEAKITKKEIYKLDMKNGNNATKLSIKGYEFEKITGEPNKKENINTWKSYVVTGKNSFKNPDGTWNNSKDQTAWLSEEQFELMKKGIIQDFTTTEDEE